MYAVSYTHLDVYKRQSVMRLKESAKKCMACGVLVLMATALISCSHQSKPLLTINGREIFENEYEAVMQQNVAQTVQDVYKRQSALLL